MVGVGRGGLNFNDLQSHLLWQCRFFLLLCLGEFGDQEGLLFWSFFSIPEGICLSH